MSGAVCIFTPDRNTPGKKDHSGAFLPEARAFAKRHGLKAADVHTAVDIGVAPGRRRTQVLDVIDSARDLETVAFFCHGLKTRLPQLGWTTANVGALAGAIARRSRPDVRVVLYACSTAEGSAPAGDNGFADALRDALCAAGAIDCQVDAHEKAGHTTRNPYVRRFEGLGSDVGGPGGYFLVTPGSTRWKAWRKKLTTPFRFDFPFMTAAQIQDAL